VRSDDTPAEAALRATARAWMEEHGGRFGRTQRHVRMVDTVEQATLARAWQRQLDQRTG
jgi:hypothetical protein